MKKALIAGAASVALAAMPVLGAFAQTGSTNFVDTLKLEIATSCNWTRTLATNNAAVTVTNATDATAIASAAAAAAGQTYTAFATSSFNVKCNNGTGYKITGTFTTLSGYESNAKEKVNNDSITYDSTLAAGKWTAKLGGTGLTSGTEGNVASTTSGDDMGTGSSYEITYDVQTKANQAAGYYEGTATYVLSQNALNNA